MSASYKCPPRNLKSHSHERLPPPPPRGLSPSPTPTMPSQDPMLADLPPPRRPRPSISRPPTTPWESYKRGGPRYPESLYSLLLTHHRQHGNNSFALSLDFGRGSGISSPTLSNHFSHTHICEASLPGLAATRKALSKTPPKHGGYTFSPTPSSSLTDCCSDSSVDFAIITESAHLEKDPDAMVRSAAAVLAPGGTLAMITHRPLAHVVGNKEAAAAVERLFKAWGTTPWEVVCGTDQEAWKRFGAGLDFVELPQELFRDVRRVAINEGEFCFPGVDAAQSRIREGEERVVLHERDAFGKGWRQEVGWEGLRSRIAMLSAEGVLEGLEGHLKEVQEVIERTSPTGVNVLLEWAVVVVLATRR
ncbi:hypothetical protein K470DRAFT_261143 [Piedraia hortae CBS 480.64]|uniref:Methyltransferase type 11 domain-containing protein n=1 Tax=Piedraia hortae CBS 480.64 TaxID=1314780 RepID=A0A6A7BP05_9PEZI|nr:hypothetical protein K470DRAFT_261143 [Piedraia hortae CBS 480.64]